TSVGFGEVIGGNAVGAVVGVVGNDVFGAGFDGNRLTKANALPAAGGFVLEGGGGEQMALVVPEVSVVGAGILLSFVKFGAGNGAGLGGGEANAELDRLPLVPGGDFGRLVGIGPKRGG